MRSKTNIFLAGMALSDLAFFLCMIPINLVNFEAIGSNLRFIDFYIRGHISLVALANWFSAASNW